MSKKKLLEGLRFPDNATSFFQKNILKNQMKKYSKNRALIIPCAGKSSRFKFLNTPKPLAQINGIPCVVRLMNDLYKYFSKVYLAVPNDIQLRNMYKQNIEKHFLGCSIEIIEVQTGKGDGDAIYEVLKEIKDINYDSFMIAWGDAVINNKELIQDCILGFNELQQITPLFFPTYEIENPYVSVARNEAGQVIKINFTRKGDFVDFGESDLCIFFCTKDIIQYLDRYRKKILNESNDEYLTYNNEFNFLETIQDIVSQKQEVVACCIGQKDDILSFNSLEELNDIQLKIT